MRKEEEGEDEQSEAAMLAAKDQIQEGTEVDKQSEGKESRFLHAEVEGLAHLAMDDNRDGSPTWEHYVQTQN